MLWLLDGGQANRWMMDMIFAGEHVSLMELPWAPETPTAGLKVVPGYYRHAEHAETPHLDACYNRVPV